MRCATLQPLDLEHVRLAVATARAGGIGLVDAVHNARAREARAVANARDLIASAADGPVAIGLRITPDVERWAPLLTLFESRPHWLVLAGWAGSRTGIEPLLARLAAPGREIWLEAGSAADVAAVAAEAPLSGWIGCGAEAGGFGGPESTFLLAQRLARQARPFYLRGGIGLYSAAACRAAGAAGVVLDDAALLVRESPLPPHWRHLIARIGPADTSAIGPEGARPVRVIDRPDAGASRAVRARAASSDPGAWDAAVADLVGWDEPERRAWPIGELAAQAAPIAARYPTIARLMRGVAEQSAVSVRAAAARPALAPGSALAREHGTAYPLVQGPMTRVSDTAAFARSVAEAGALPFAALALMRGAPAGALLDETARAVGARPWGAGILGFVPPDLRAEQLAAIERVRPPFALIAGGRPDQAASLEALGIRTYVHVPAPLLAPYLAQGARRLIFEGAECGGHVGPLHSFALWDTAVSTLLAALPDADLASLGVLFAGGIHDARSAAMVDALAAPLAARGVRVGALMGTAYLFTAEACAGSAITPRFQEVAIASGLTATIETGPGHVIRCAPTPFVGAFAREKRALLEQGLHGHDLADRLDRLIVGRSRVASKGIVRDGAALAPVDERRQYDEGLYMLGEAAALREQVVPIAALHREVSEDSARVLQSAASAAAPDEARPRAGSKPADVAIVGLSCLAPGAPDAAAFWRNLLDGAGAIREVPIERWDWRLYFDADPAARDRIYSRWGGFVDPIPFDPIRYGIPPRSLAAITIPQLLALELTRQALVDAGCGDAIADAAVRERTAVVFGIGNTADVEQFYQARAALPLLVGEAAEDVLRRMPEWTEESYPGLLASVVAGRVANRFDFGGPNLTVDAACASSLAALDLAVRELTEGRSDVVVAGGLEFEMSPQAFMGFSRTRALSPRGRADVFDRGADGIVIAEGGVVLVLKRLADAERDGDRIYAVIKAVAGSSDGRGLSLTAPSTRGQRLAVDRAWAAAGADPATAGLYEAHGTGTALGDAAELTTIDSLLREHGAGPDRCVAGSLKSAIGHTRTAAGMLAVAKAALALHHRVLPPHTGVREPAEPLAREDAPVCLLGEPRPWLRDAERPRRAGVSAFGFGGTNFHAVLEEHAAGAGEASAGGAIWPCEVFVFAAPDRAALIAAIARAERAATALLVSRDAHDPPPFTLADLAHACAAAARAGGAARAAFTASSAEELLARAGAARASAEGDGRAAAAPAAVHVGQGAADGDIAFLFPGQGSQYVGMGRELALYAPEVRAAFELADRVVTGLPDTLSRVVLPPAAFTDEDAARQDARLTDTRVAQPALGTLSAGMLDLARRLGIEMAAAAGHSYGELTALHAAGAFDRETLLRLSAARGAAMAGGQAAPGAMAMVSAPAAAIAPLLPADGRVAVANVNAPDQTVISGDAAAVAALAARLRDAGYTTAPLRVSAAFHSPQMAGAADAFARALDAASLSMAAARVHGNRDGSPIEDRGDDLRARLAAHLEQPVDFVAVVEALYRAGARTFIELGAGRVLTGLTRRILGTRPHRAIAADGGVRGWLDAIAAVFAAGHAVDVLAVFNGRRIAPLDLDRLPDSSGARAGWLIDGGRVWPRGAAARPMGAAPFLTKDTAAPATPVPETNRAQALEAYREYEKTMRAFLEQQERLLRGMLGGEPLPEPPGLPAAAPVLPAAPLADAHPRHAAPRQPQLAPPAHGAAGADALMPRLVAIVSDRTGYDAASLGPDLDLEADLGIDSIKRMEVLATLLAELPAADGARLQGELDRLTRQRSLAAIVALVERALGDSRTPPPPVSAAAHAAAPRPVPRFVMRAVRAPLDAIAAHGPHRGAGDHEGLHLVTEDACGVAPLLIDRLGRAGVRACLIERDTLADDARLDRRIRELTRAHGPVVGIVHLSALGRPPAADRVDAWRAEADATTKALFRLLRRTAADLDAAGARASVLAVTAMGGDGGRSACPAGAEMAAGCHGLLRSFEREYPDLRAWVADVDADMPPSDLARLIDGELGARDEAREIGYLRGTRVMFVPEPAELEGADARVTGLPLREGSLVLITGGAAGVTAEVAREFAVPGARLVIVGRTPFDRLPAERRDRLRDLERRGAIVDYRAADVRDEAAFGALIDGLYAGHGRIDAVLHGAGLIEDQRVELKETASFDRVFDTKVDGALVLLQHLRGDGLAWVVFFSSVSGRFGNPGQGDYGAANETLNRLAFTAHRRWPGTRVVSINWGPWRGTGMMSDAILAVAAARGLEPIEVADGVRFVADEIRAGADAGVEVIAGNGPWAAMAGAAPASSILLS